MDYESKRTQLIEYLVTKQAIRTNSVKQAFLSIKREEFVPDPIKPNAYIDEAMPIGKDQTISQPTTIAIMLETLKVEKGQKVLEVGSGCGYVVALLSKLVGENGKVYGIDIIPELVEQSKKNLEKNEIKNVEIFLTDGANGLEEKAPYDRILISCACPYVPKPLFDQLKEDGRIVAPVGKFMQTIEILKKKNGQLIKEQFPGFFAFVPMISKDLWP